MPLVTLMRHADRLDATEGAVTTRLHDTPLSLTGVTRALNTKIPAVKKVVCSPLLRTVHTAVLSSGTLHLEDNTFTFDPVELFLDNRMCEVWNRRVLKVDDLSQATMLSVDELHQAIGIQFVAHHSIYPLPAVEETRGINGSGDVRYRAAIQAIASENTDIDHVLIVTHGEALGSFAEMLGRTVYETNYCSYITADYKDGRWEFVNSNGVGIFS